MHFWVRCPVAKIVGALASALPSLVCRPSAAASAAASGAGSSLRPMSAAAKKYGALGTFVLQNAGVVLLMRYTKVYPGTHVAYSSTAAVLMTEVTKMPLCFVLETYQRGGPCSFLSGVKHDLATNGLEWLKLCLPALLLHIFLANCFQNMSMLLHVQLPDKQLPARRHRAYCDCFPCAVEAVSILSHAIVD